MIIRDFTTRHYEELLSAGYESGWEFLTVRDYLQVDPLPDNFLVLRHDVDRKVGHARTLARIEAAYGISGTYYFRTSTFDPELVREIADLGHEIGYHYEDLAATDGDMAEAERRFAANLSSFREVVDIDTVCAHGSAFSSQYNPDLWAGRLDELRNYDVVGDAYLSMDMGPEHDTYYLSDTHRTWETTLADFGIDDTTSSLLELPAVGTIERTEDLVTALQSHPCSGLYILAHPSRWSRSRGELAQMVTWDLSAEIAMEAIDRTRSLLP